MMYDAIVGRQIRRPNGPAPEAGWSAVRTVRTGGPEGPRAKSIRVPSFLLRLLARFAELTRRFVYNGSSPPPL
jgi:hypothetical protein